MCGPRNPNPPKGCTWPTGVASLQFLVWVALGSLCPLSKWGCLFSLVFLRVSQAPQLQVWQAANTKHVLSLCTPQGVAQGDGQYPGHWADSWYLLRYLSLWTLNKAKPVAATVGSYAEVCWEPEGTVVRKCLHNSKGSCMGVTLGGGLGRGSGQGPWRCEESSQPRVPRPGFLSFLSWSLSFLICEMG